MKRTALLFTIALFSICGVKAQERYSTNDPDVNFEKGKDLFMQKQYAISTKYLRNFIEQNEDKTVCQLCQEAEYYIVSSSYFMKEKDAMNKLKDYLEKYPYSPMNHYVNYYIGRINYEKKKYTHAIEYYEQVNEECLSNEDYEEYIFSKGYSYLMEKDYQSASRNFLSLTGGNQKYRKDAEYYYAYSEFCLKNYKNALETFININSSSNYYEAALFHALQIYDQLKYRKAAVELGKQLIGTYPKSKYLSEAYRILGENSYFNRSWNDAAKYLDLYSKGQTKVQRSDMYMLGISYYMNQDYDKSVKALGKVTTDKDSLAQNAYIFIGHSHLQQKQPDRARMAFQNASQIEADPKSQEEALYNYALATYESNAPFGEMIKSYEKFVTEYPASKHLNVIYEHMANVYLTDKNYAGAIKSIDKIARPTQKLIQAKEHALLHLGIDCYNKRQYEEAINYFNKSIEINSSKSFSAQAYLWLGETYYQMKDVDAARKNFNTFLNSKQGKTQNQIEKAYYTLAYSYFDEKNYKKALMYFNTFNDMKEAKKSPVFFDVQNRIGDCYFLQRDFKAARRVYTSIDPHAPGADYAKFQNAFILGIQKQYDAKINALNTLISKYPRSEYNDDAMYEIGRTYVLMEQHDNAIDAYKKLQAAHPVSKQTRKASLEIGMQYANMNQNDNAIEAYKFVIKEYPASEEAKVALESMQSLCVDENRVEEFLDYKKSLKNTAIVSAATSDEDSISFIAAERVYARANYKEAIGSLKNYITKYCDNQTMNCITAQYYLAESLYNTGDTAQAIIYYDKLTKIEGNSYFENSLLRASAIAYDNKNYEAAKTYFEGLKKYADDATNKSIASLGILRCSHFTNQYDAVISSATDIIENNNSDENNLREAHYCRAKAYIAKKDENNAADDLLAISNNISFEMGAEAKYLYAEYLFKNEDYAGSEKVIMEFIQEGTPFQYWLARCFVLLSDIYATQGDDFMAKQYLLSLQENYSSDDDIQTMIKERLDAITAREAEEILE